MKINKIYMIRWRQCGDIAVNDSNPSRRELHINRVRRDLVPPKWLEPKMATDI